MSPCDFPVRVPLHPLPHFTSRRKFGGDEEDRTPDPLLARQVLSQLSYTPTGLQGFRYASVFLEVLIQTLKIKQHLLDFPCTDQSQNSLFHLFVSP